MAKISEVYSGAYVTAAELTPGRRITAVVAGAEVTVVGQGDAASQKVVLSLKNRAGVQWPRQLVCNKSNATLLAAAFGDETREWPGHTLEIWAEPVMYQGKLVPGIKVMPLPSQGPTIAPSRGSDIPADTSNLAADLDDEIPF